MIDYTPKKKSLNMSKFASKPVRRLTTESPFKSGYNPRETVRIPSKVTSGGSASLRETMTYTGDKMIGISIIHKSCLQPVFSQEEAAAAASMRR